MERVGRLVSMSLYLIDALHDQVEPDATVLFDRFFGWVRASGASVQTRSKLAMRRNPTRAY